MKRIKGLDTLRALAVIFVIKAHWGPVFYDTEPVGKFIQTFILPDGAAAVYMFFVLSGFLITGILLKARTDNNDKNAFFTIKNFFARRALRIFPIYYLLIIILYFIAPDVKENIAYFLTYTSNILCYRTNSWNSASHTWTLAVEEQFYIFWPWLILLVNKKYLKYVFISSIIIGLVSTYYVLQTKMEPFLVFNCIDAFAIGGLYAYVRQDLVLCRKFEKWVKIIAPFLLIPYAFWKSSVYTHREPGIFMFKTVYSVLFIWVIVLVVNNRSEIIRKYFLENRVLNFIGKISYGIYLFHPYIPNATPYIVSFINNNLATHHRTHDFLLNPHVLYIDYLLLLLLVCWLSYTLIEQPLLSLKRLFKYAKGTRKSGVPTGPQ